MTELVKEVASRNDMPADVKASVDAFNKELTALVPKFAAAGGGRGGGGGGGRRAAGRGGAPRLRRLDRRADAAGGQRAARITLAKNGMMGGMSPTAMATKAYADAKAMAPKAFADANALFAKAATLSTALAKYKLKLAAPAPVKVPASTAAGTKK